MTILVGLGLGSKMMVFLTLAAIFWAIFTHMAAELVGVPSRFSTALLSTLVGWAAAEIFVLTVSNAMLPSIVVGAVGSYVGMRIFYRAPPLRSFALFAVSTLVTIAVFGGIVAYMAIPRSRV